MQKPPLPPSLEPMVNPRYLFWWLDIGGSKRPAGAGLNDCEKLSALSTG